MTNLQQTGVRCLEEGKLFPNSHKRTFRIEWRKCQRLKHQACPEIGYNLRGAELTPHPQAKAQCVVSLPIWNSKFPLKGVGSLYFCMMSLDGKSSTTQGLPELLNLHQVPTSRTQISFCQEIFRTVDGAKESHPALPVWAPIWLTRPDRFPSWYFTAQHQAPENCLCRAPSAKGQTAFQLGYQGRALLPPPQLCLP